MTGTSDRNQKLPAAAGSNAAYPLFYRRPVVLHFEEHGKKAIAPQSDYRFAAKTNAVPISVAEFSSTVSHYPVVFAEGELAPVVVLSLKQGENHFLEAGGDWRRETYVPAYLRRYPFILAHSPGQDSRALAVDAESERFVELADSDPGRRIFNADGAPSPLAGQILAFCEAYHQQHLHSIEFVNALKDADLLVARHASMRFPDQSRYQLGGFRLVDPDRYRKLPAETLQAWHEKGWLDAIALHLASQKNWNLLMKLDRDQTEVA